MWWVSWRRLGLGWNWSLRAMFVWKYIVIRLMKRLPLLCKTNLNIMWILFQDDGGGFLSSSLTWLNNCMPMAKRILRKFATFADKTKHNNSFILDWRFGRSINTGISSLYLTCTLLLHVDTSSYTFPVHT